MCKTFYKYYLITSTSFMASSGFYFLCLTRWLWTSPIYDYGDYDWRTVPESLGAICFILFSITLLIGLRARPRELFVLAMLTAALVVILVPILSVQMFRKPQIIFDLSDLFLLIVAIISGSIVIDIFLYIHSLRKFRSRNTFAKANRQFSPVEL